MVIMLKALFYNPLAAFWPTKFKDALYTWQGELGLTGPIVIEVTKILEFWKCFLLDWQQRHYSEGGAGVFMALELPSLNINICKA